MCFSVTTKDTLTVKAAQTPDSCHLPFVLLSFLPEFLPGTHYSHLALGTPDSASNLPLGTILFFCLFIYLFKYLFYFGA